MLGFLNINKPPDITAHDVVSSVRKQLGIKRIGHGGTLDPMASGVIPVGVDRACRLLRFLPETKTYLAEILLGTSTDTDDVTGATIATTEEMPDLQQVQITLSNFIGELEQCPPAYSAVHYQGKRLYSLARQGKVPENIPLRKIKIYHLDILSIELPVIQVRIICSSGTYIRSIARDLGQQLGCGGCLKSLIREQAGNFNIKDAISLQELEMAATKSSVPGLLIDPVTVLPFEQLEVDSYQASAIILGKKVLWEYSSNLVTSSIVVDSSKTPLVLVTSSGMLIALCHKDSSGYLLPEVVIAESC